MAEVLLKLVGEGIQLAEVCQQGKPGIGIDASCVCRSTQRSWPLGRGLELQQRLRWTVRFGFQTLPSRFTIATRHPRQPTLGGPSKMHEVVAGYMQQGWQPMTELVV